MIFRLDEPKNLLKTELTFFDYKLSLQYLALFDRGRCSLTYGAEQSQVYLDLVRACLHQIRLGKPLDSNYLLVFYEATGRVAGEGAKIYN